MVVLSRGTEQSDALNVLAADRREVALEIRTAEPLRKARSRKQRRRLLRLRTDAASQVARQLEGAGRRSFRGRIAVHLQLGLPPRHRETELRRIVKDYLDVLKENVVFDDSQVDHLIVERRDAPGLEAVVTARCLPVSTFAAEYDRAFRVLGERPAPERSMALFMNGAPVDPALSWGQTPLGQLEREALARDEEMLAEIERVDEDEAEQLGDDPDAGWVDLDLGSLPREFEDWQVRENVAEQLRRSIAYRRGSQIADNGFDARDRPGPAPSWLAETSMLDVADVERLPDAGPGCFILPEPPNRPTDPGELRWADRVEREFGRALAGGWKRARFHGPLALDIALHGGAGLHADIDNVAHVVIQRFVGAFENTELRIEGYRAYRRPSSRRNDVQVRVIPAVRLDALVRAMSSARELVRAERGKRGY